MNILHIASIYPVKDSPLENEYVRNFILEYKKAGDNASFSVVKPQTYLPGLMMRFRKNINVWSAKRKIANTKIYNEHGINIYIAPYWSIGTISMLHALFSSLAFFRNRKLFQSEVVQKADVCHAHYLFPDGLIAYQLKRKYGIPYVLTLQKEDRFFRNVISRRIALKIIRHSGNTTTLSPHMKDILISHEIKNISLLALGIRAQFFLPGISASPKSLTNKKLNLVSVCHFTPVKNLESVIKALSVIDKSSYNYTIYGSGPLEMELKQMVIDEGLQDNITFQGIVKNEDLPGLLPKYDLFIQPSFKETFGLSYFEALACGLPVVLSENTGALHFIKDFNVAFVVDPYDVSSIRNCLVGIIEDKNLLVEKGKNCLEAAKVASWSNYVNHFKKAYNDISDEIKK